MSTTQNITLVEGQALAIGIRLNDSSTASSGNWRVYGGASCDGINVATSTSIGSSGSYAISLPGLSLPPRPMAAWQYAIYALRSDGREFTLVRGLIQILPRQS